MSSVDGELSSSCCISPIIRGAALSSVTLLTPPPHPHLPPALVKIFTVSRSTSSPTSSSLLLLPVPSPHPYSPPPHTHTHAPAATAQHRLWLKHDGRPFEAQGHPHHHHLSSSVERRTLVQFNQHREGDMVNPPHPPPAPAAHPYLQPWGFYVSIWKVRLAGGGVTGIASIVSDSAI